jgi:hypothetical protein
LIATGAVGMDPGSTLLLAKKEEADDPADIGFI